MFQYLPCAPSFDEEKGVRLIRLQTVMDDKTHDMIFLSLESVFEHNAEMNAAYKEVKRRRDFYAFTLRRKYNARLQHMIRLEYSNGNAV